MPKGSFDPHRKTFGVQMLTKDLVVEDGKTVSTDAYESGLWGSDSYCAWKVHHYTTNPAHLPCTDKYFHKCMDIVPKREREMHAQMHSLLSKCPSNIDHPSVHPILR